MDSFRDRSHTAWKVWKLRILRIGIGGRNSPKIEPLDTFYTFMAYTDIATSACLATNQPTIRLFHTHVVSKHGERSQQGDRRSVYRRRASVFYTGIPNMYRERSNSSTMNKIRIRITVGMYDVSHCYESIKVNLLFLSSHPTPSQHTITSNINLPLQYTPSDLHDKPQQSPPCTSR
jgi:hypothetical protein